MIRRATRRKKEAPGKKGGKSADRLTEAKLIQLGQEWYEKMEREGIRQAAIAKASPYSPSLVSRAIRKYLATRDQKGPLEATPRDAKLEEDLQRIYPSLLDCIVVRTPDDIHLDSQATQERLGEAAADYLKRIIRPGDRLGISGGRAIYFATIRLRSEGLRQQGVKVVRVCHDVEPRPVIDIKDPRGNKHRVSAAPQDLERVLADVLQDEESHTECWTKKAVNAHKPSFAVCGVGAMTGEQNRFIVLAKEPDATKPVVRSMQELRRLKEIVETELNPGAGATSQEERDGYAFRQDLSVVDPHFKLLLGPRAESLPAYVPVGDIANALFYVRPVGLLGPRDSASRRSLQEMIDAEGERNYQFALSCGLDGLREIGDVLVVAGGRRKLWALHTLLSPEDHSPVTRLCIDADTAELLVALGTYATR